MVLGGVAEHGLLDDGLRQRNIFPLPKLSGGGRSGPQSSIDWEDAANAGIRALNELSGCLISFSSKKPTRAQRRVLQHISHAFQDCQVDPTFEAGRSCLEALCSSSRLYQVDRSDVVSYAKDLVSWPEASSTPVPLVGCLGPADSEWLATWRKHMLRASGDGIGVGSLQPYTDPVLKHNKREYAGFLHELHIRNMIRFRVDQDHGQSPSLGIFFVRKKNGKQRLIFDTRVLNQHFTDPPSTDLPSADAFTRLEIPEDEGFYIGSGDLANAFYTLEVPDDLGQMFSLPAIEAGRLGLHHSDHALRPETVVVPYLTVLPMGWAWALHLCQGVLMNAIHSAGFIDEQIISDKSNPVHLHSNSDIAVAGYVDNFAVIGCDRTVVNAGLAAISERLRGLGLTVHEEVEATTNADFVGLNFDGSSGFVSIKPTRIQRLQKALHELLSRNFASGELIQVVLGHITWAMMSRREGLAILNSCYAFCHKNKQQACRLWPSVRRELQWVATLLPLFRAKINVGWSSDVHASDSSPMGFGVCQRFIDKEAVRLIGSQSERWRFRFEDAVDARAHAAKTLGTDSLEKDSLSRIQPSSLQSIIDDLNQHGFHEVPPHLMTQGDWTVVQSSPWKFEDNILKTEGLALVWSIEHALRSNRNLGKRMLFLCDNLPLALCASKGRARSGYLAQVLRKICALSLASGSKFHARWVPSEWNSADRPSRAVTQWAARGLSGWASDRSSDLTRHGSTRAEVKSAKGKKIVSPFSSSHPVPCTSRTHVPGGPKHSNSNFEGLSTTYGHVQPMAAPPGLESLVSTTDGRVPCGLSPGVVRRWEGGERRSQSPSCSSLLPSGVGDFFDEVVKGIEGVALGSSTNAADAHPTGSPLCCDGGVPSARTCGGSHSPDAPVHDIPASWRVQQSPSQAAGGTADVHEPGLQVLGHPAQSKRGPGSRKDRRLRWVRDHRLRHLDSNFSLQPGSSSQPGRSAMEDGPWKPASSVQSSHLVARPGTLGADPLHSTSWRSHPRHLGPQEKHARDQAARPLEQRCVSQAVRQAGKASNRVAESSTPSKGLRDDGFKTFASVSHQSKPDPPGSHWNSQVTRRLRRRPPVPVKGPKTLKGSQVLRRMFQAERRRFGNTFRGVFLDLFSGDGHISRHLRRLGYPVVSVDICDDARFDLTNSDVLNVILGWIRGNCVLGVWLATVCTSWSRARHGPVGSSWGPIRSDHYVMGLPGINPSDELKVRLGNSTMRISARIIHACIKTTICCFLENPAGSLMWKAPPLLKVCSHKCSRVFVCDFCQYGARWRKRTRIQGWHSQLDSDLSRTCSGHQGQCSRSGKFHIVLHGQDPVSRQLWTHLAQPYPNAFAKAAALALANSYEALESFKYKSRFGL